MKFTKTEWEIIAHRLVLPERIHECLESDEYPYSLEDVQEICDRLLEIQPGEEMPIDELSLIVLEDAFTGSTLLPSLFKCMESPKAEERAMWRKYYMAAKEVEKRTGWTAMIF